MNKVTGRVQFVADQLMQKRETVELYRKYGVHGIEYAILFGWIGSIYIDEDIDVRHDQVYDMTFGSEIEDPITGETSFPKRDISKDVSIWRDPLVERFIDFINSKTSSSRLSLIKFYEEEFNKLRSQSHLVDLRDDILEYEKIQEADFDADPLDSDEDAIRKKIIFDQSQIEKKKALISLMDSKAGVQKKNNENLAVIRKAWNELADDIESRINSGTILSMNDMYD